MARGLNNKNPGNLIAVKSHYFIGEVTVTKDPPYRQFYEIEFGYRSMFKEIKMIMLKLPHTVTSLISIWSKTNTIKYIEYVSKGLGVQPEQLINFNDEKILKETVYLISTFENGIPAVHSEIDKGYDLLTDTKMQ